MNAFEELGNRYANAVTETLAELGIKPTPDLVAHFMAKAMAREQRPMVERDALLPFANSAVASYRLMRDFAGQPPPAGKAAGS